MIEKGAIQSLSRTDYRWYDRFMPSTAGKNDLVSFGVITATLPASVPGGQMLRNCWVKGRGSLGDQPALMEVTWTELASGKRSDDVSTEDTTENGWLSLSQRPPASRSGQCRRSPSLRTDPGSDLEAIRRWNFLSSRLDNFFMEAAIWVCWK